MDRLGIARALGETADLLALTGEEPFRARAYQRGARVLEALSDADFGRLLAEVTPGNLKMSFFTNGGAEANENAIRIARTVTGRPKVLARYRAYHGATAGAISLTGDPRRYWGGSPVNPYPLLRNGRATPHRTAK